MGKDNDRYNRRQFNEDKGRGSIRTAVIVFVVTLLVILGIGIPALFIISSSRKNEQPQVTTTTTKWEMIPEASTVTNLTPVTETEEKEELVIPEEDKDYTHIIQTIADDVVTIGFAGDILFDDNYAVGNAFKKCGNSAVGVVGSSLLDKMNGVDIMMVNNEFPYSNGGSPTEGKTYTFRARPETASILNDMGVDIVGLANNHAYDYGEKAFLDTLDTLDNIGIEYAGAGRNIEEASHTIYYVTEDGMRIAIICATQIERLSNPDTKGATETSPGVFRCLDNTLLLERIREAKEKNSYVIVFIHWGTESTTEIDYLQRDQAKEMVEAGADLIMGSHPHILQKIDYVNGVPVVYSMGNYIFNSKDIDTCMMIATLHKDGTVNLQMVPALQRGCTVKEAFDSEAIRIWDYEMSMSPNINIDLNGYISPK